MIHSYINNYMERERERECPSSTKSPDRREETDAQDPEKKNKNKSHRKTQRGEVCCVFMWLPKRDCVFGLKLVEDSGTSHYSILFYRD